MRRKTQKIIAMFFIAMSLSACGGSEVTSSNPIVAIAGEDVFPVASVPQYGDAPPTPPGFKGTLPQEQ